MKLSQKSVSILTQLHKAPTNRLDIELATGYAPLHHQISSLVQDGYVRSLPRESRQLVKYILTRKGEEAIGVIRQREESLRYRPISELPLYVPKDMPVRPGSMVAYSLPSRGMQ